MQRGWVAHLLQPLTWCYRTLTALRRQLYRMEVIRPHRADALVIVVGNVIAGGAGKTPTVIEIIQHLQARKLAAGVVSRGYGRSSSECEEVTRTTLAKTVGDEPTLIHHATGAPVFVAKSRYAGAVELLSKYPDTQIIVCDDGLQHYGIFRDIEVCVFDDRGLGNGWLLPAGPLREHWPRAALSAVGQSNERLMVLHTGQQAKFAGYRAQRKLGKQCRLRDGQTTSIDEFLSTVRKPILAVAGIAQPERFFEMVREMGIPIAKTMAMPDHSDFQQISPKDLAPYQLICTEKDAFKLWDIVPDVVAIPLEQKSEPEFFQRLDAHIDSAMAARLSSTDGHQIT